MAKPLKPKSTIDTVEDFLYELGPVRGEKVTFKGIEFEVAKSQRKNPPTLEIIFEYPGSKSALNTFKSSHI